LAARIHAHHAAKVAARGSSGGASYGSSGAVAVYRPAYGSSGGSSGGASYGSAVSYGSTGGSSGGVMSSIESPIYESYRPMISDGYETGTVVEPSAIEPTPEPAADAADPAGEASIDRDAALLTVAVAENAIVKVNGLPTTSEGAVRQFMSKGLQDGLVYTYVVEVTYPGVDATASKTVKLRAGAIERLVFSAPASDSNETQTVSAPASPETVVTVRVPADAKVNLAGNDTNGNGEVRTFRTRQLASGQKWNNYTIRVTAEVNGVPVSKEKTIDLLAGTEHDFAFDFDDATVASR
jgi:uncharacterized protein (TIGR03000 family)